MKYRKVPILCAAVSSVLKYSFTGTLVVAAQLTLPAQTGSKTQPGLAPPPLHWAWTSIDATQAWDVWTTAAEKVEPVVAVLDNGFDLDHFELKSHLWGTAGKHGYDFVDDDDVPEPVPPSTYHGTFVAGLIGADHGNFLGIAGVSPNARLMLLRWDGEGLTVAKRADNLIRAVSFALTNGAKVVNISAAFVLRKTAAEDQIIQGLLHERFQSAASSNVLIVCAVANDPLNNSDLDDPANLFFEAPAMFEFDNIICVTGLRPNPERQVYEYGKSSVDIAAPAAGIPGPAPDDLFRFDDGASFATAFVSGSAGLIWSIMPKLHATEVRALLLGKAKLLSVNTGKEWGHKPPAVHNGALDLTFVKDAYDAYTNGVAYGACFPAHAKDRP